MFSPPNDILIYVFVAIEVFYDSKAAEAVWDYVKTKPKFATFDITYG